MENVPDLSVLSERQLELAKHLHSGKGVKESADAMEIGEVTARNYLNLSLQKLHLSNKTELIVAYERWRAANQG